MNDADVDHRLDGLVGHANFVAGVIAQECPNAQIRVISHNSAFIEDADTALDAIPTEASVARSLWKSLGADPMPSVVNVGFVFPTLPNADRLRNVSDFNGPPSWTFDLVLSARDTRNQQIIVAPAGNQGCTTRQYPGAFDQVVSVGSSGRYGRRSDFSNYGDWVKVFVEGENVVSTFIDDWPQEEIDDGTEEADPDGSHPRKDFRSGWAIWNGTSFAAPKVAAYIASGVATGQGIPPGQAWANWKALYERLAIAVPNTRIRRP